MNHLRALDRINLRTHSGKSSGRLPLHLLQAVLPHVRLGSGFGLVGPMFLSLSRTAVQFGERRSSGREGRIGTGPGMGIACPPEDVKDERRRAMKTGAGERAFSMVELLVAISLTAVLIGIAAMRLPAFYGQYELTSAARQMATDLVRVRAKAIGTSNQYQVVFAEKSYQVKVNSAGSFVNDGSATKLPNGARIPTLPDALTFNPIGMLSAASTITVTTVAGSKQVSINEVGRVQVQ